MTSPGGGYDRDVGAGTDRGRSGFIGRRRQADDVNAPGAGEAEPDAAEPGTDEAAPPAGPGAPDDLLSGERNSPLTDS
jgi:hypothetical protein